MRKAVLVTAVALAGLMAPAAAQAATTIGSTAGTPSPGPSSPFYFFQVGSAPGKSYAVPAGGGVITSWSAFVVNPSPVTYELKILRGTAVVAEAPGTVDSTPGPGAVKTFPARVAVQAGDILGIWVPSGGNSPPAASSGASLIYGNAEPAIGAPPPSPLGASNYEAIISAVVEPDADGDGYGDETQDACLNDAGRHVEPCGSDLHVTAAVRDASIGVGATTIVTVSATASAPAGRASGVSVGIALPPGLELLAGVTPDGDCTGTGPVACPLGDIAAGATKRAVLVVRGAQAGSQSIAATATSTSIEQTVADNAATAALTVTPGPPPPCKVPKVVGAKLKAATLKVAQAGCRLGKVKKPKRAKAAKLRVRSQSIPAGTRVVSGTKVALVLAVRR